MPFGSNCYITTLNSRKPHYHVILSRSEMFRYSVTREVISSADHLFQWDVSYSSKPFQWSKKAHSDHPRISIVPILRFVFIVLRSASVVVLLSNLEVRMDIMLGEQRLPVSNVVSSLKDLSF